MTTIIGVAQSLSGVVVPALVAALRAHLGVAAALAAVVSAEAAAALAAAARREDGDHGLA